MSLGAVGPAYTQGEMEKPAGSKDMGGWTAAVYTGEQQLRLAVDERGNQKRASQLGLLGPAHTRGDIEAPVGTKDMGDWKAAVYTGEQQLRLGVDEEGNKLAPKGLSVGGSGSIGPAHTRGEMEPPAGEKSIGSSTAAVYTGEQQLRLGVDEQGNAKRPSVVAIAADEQGNSRPVFTGGDEQCDQAGGGVSDASQSETASKPSQEPKPKPGWLPQIIPLCCSSSRK